MASPQTIVRFPVERVPNAAAIGASRLQIWRGRVRNLFGRSLNRLGVPGAIQNVSVEDALTGHVLSVAVGATYVRLTVNDRDYYFDRVTGRFDGTGGVP
jgi:hypothetical protein